MFLELMLHLAADSSEGQGCKRNHCWPRRAAENESWVRSRHDILSGQVEMISNAKYQKDVNVRATWSSLQIRNVFAALFTVSYLKGAYE